MEIKIVKKQITKDDIEKLAEEWFGTMVKAVVDLEKNIIAIGGEMHADAEAMLIEQGSKQDNLWGINLYPNEKDHEFIKYISLINISPRRKNLDMEIQDPEIKSRIKRLIDKLIV